MKPVDEYFRQQLGPLAVPPRPEAWNRIANNLVKKNSGRVGFRWAAVLGMLASLAGMWWYLEQTPVNAHISGGQTGADPQAVVQPLAAISDEKPAPEPVRQQPVIKKTPRLATTNKINLSAPAAAPVEPAGSSLFAGVEPGAPPQNQEPVPTDEALPQGAVVVEYSLPAITAAPADGAGPPKESNLGKIKTAVQDLKNSQAWWGDLRKIKDDVLAFNFKKDKTKPLE